MLTVNRTMAASITRLVEFVKAGRLIKHGDMDLDCGSIIGTGRW